VIDSRLTIALRYIDNVDTRSYNVWSE